MHTPKTLVLALLVGTFTGSVCASTPQKSTAKTKPPEVTIEQLLERNDTTKAEQRLNAHLAAHPMDVHAMTLFGRMREQQHLYKQAEASYRIALRADPTSEEATAALGNLLSAEGRYDDAIAVLQPMYEANPANPSVGPLLASLYEKQGKFTESLSVCDQLPAPLQLTVSPLVIVDRLMLGQEREVPPLIAELLKHSVAQPQLVAELAAALLRHGLVADASDLLRVASERLKPTAALLAATAEAEGRQGHMEQAIQLAKRARQLDPNSIEALITSSQIAAVQKDWATAAEYLEQVRKLAPPRIEVLQSLTYAYMQLRKADPAHSAALEWHELQPNSVDGTLALGMVMVQALHWGEADELLGKVLAERPGDKAAHLARGMAEYNLGKLDAAVQDLTASLGQGPADAEAHYHLGLVAKQRGDIPGAIKEMEAAIAIDPQRQLALTSLGQMYTQQGNFERARVVLERAIAKAPDDAQSHYQLSTVYRRLSMPEKAREQVEIFQRLNRASASPNKTKDN